jgi:hypothetical protein
LDGRTACERIVYDLRAIAPTKAREVVRKVLLHMNGNVTETARILGISRPTVRRARDGILGDCSSILKARHLNPDQNTPGGTPTVQALKNYRAGIPVIRVTEQVLVD